MANPVASGKMAQGANVQPCVPHISEAGGCNADRDDAEILTTRYRAVLYKLIIFAVLMAVVPIGTYFLSLHRFTSGQFVRARVDRPGTDSRQARRQSPLSARWSLRTWCWWGTSLLRSGKMRVDLVLGSRLPRLY